MARAAAEFSKVQALIEATKELVEAVSVDAAAGAVSAAAAPLEVCKTAVAAVGNLPNLHLALERPKVGVGVILVSSSHPGKVLIGERKGSHGAGKWALPGGHLEYGEPWGLCAEREVEEEAGLHIHESRFAFVHVTNDVMEAEHLHYITLFVKADLNAEETAKIINGEPDKCLGWHWLSPEEIEPLPKFIPLEHLLQAGGLSKAL